MTTTNLKTIKALEAFIDCTQLAAFSVLGSESERNDFAHKTLVNIVGHTMLHLRAFT